MATIRGCAEHFVGRRRYPVVEPSDCEKTGDDYTKVDDIAGTEPIASSSIGVPLCKESYEDQAAGS